MISGIFGAIEKLIEFHKINEWIKLYTSLFASFVLSCSFVSGSALTLHRPTMESFGCGLIAGAISAAALWRRSPLTKGMSLVLPAAEAAKEIETDLQTISK